VSLLESANLTLSRLALIARHLGRVRQRTDQQPHRHCPTAGVRSSLGEGTASQSVVRFDGSYRSRIIDGKQSGGGGHRGGHGPDAGSGRGAERRLPRGSRGTRGRPPAPPDGAAEGFHARGGRRRSVRLQRGAQRDRRRPARRSRSLPGATPNAPPDADGADLNPGARRPSSTPDAQRHA
jgi:hypothetical protein